MMQISFRRRGVSLAGVCALALLAPAACRAPFSDDFRFPPGSAWEARGRLVMEDAERKHALSFNWRWRGRRNSLQCSDLLGRTLFRIDSVPEGGVRFIGRDGEARKAEDEDALMRQLLGRAIPIRLLRDWMRGRAASGAEIQSSERAPDGRLLRLQQAGWSLEFSQHRRRGKWELPTRVRAQREDLRLHLRIWDWKTPDSAD